MSPCIVTRDGQLVLGIGTPGSYGILQTTLQMLLNSLDFGMHIQAAIEAPRVRAFERTRVDVEGRLSDRGAWPTWSSAATRCACSSPGRGPSAAATASPATPTPRS